MAELSSLRELEEIRNPLAVSAQEATDVLSQREESARVAGTVSPFQSSFNPFNPNFRATAQNAISNMLGGSNIASSDNYLGGRVANTLTSLLDFAPWLGDGMGIGDTMTSYRQGDMLGTGINAAATGIGVLPIVGGPASKAVKAGGNRVRSALRGIDAWHGSPYEFENFSMDKMGTGEGAQAYGDGLYFAEQRGIGEGYRERLSAGVVPAMRPSQAINMSGWNDEARALFPDDPKRQAGFKLLNQMKSKKDVLKYANDYRANTGDFSWPDSNKTEVSLSQDELSEMADEFYNEGSLYNVNLNVEPDELLDWDGTFSTQPEKVQDALRSLTDKVKGEGYYDEMQGFGDNDYRDWASNVMEDYDPAQLSEMMKNEGIKGIRYLDGTSRSAGEGTRNYVIFDDSLIDTKRVNDKLTDSWMNPEARMARADEQGLTKTLYHGTHADIEEFDPNMVDIGTHLGTLEQANERLKDVYRSRNGLSTFVGGDEVASGANVMPVRANLGKSLEMNDVGMWSDSEKVISELEDMPEFRGKFDNAWEELGVKDSYGDSQDWINSTENREMLDEINAEIRRQGYDSIRYANQVENKYGNLAGTRPEVATRKKILSDELKAIDLSRRPATREAPTIEDVKINPNAVEEWIKESNVKASYSPQQEQRMIQINQELKSLDELNKDDIYSYIILEPKNIRSTNAEFDPTKADSSDLLSSISPTQSSLRNIA